MEDFSHFCKKSQGSRQCRVSFAWFPPWVNYYNLRSLSFDEDSKVTEEKWQNSVVVITSAIAHAIGTPEIVKLQGVRIHSQLQNDLFTNFQRNVLGLLDLKRRGLVSFL